MFNLRRFRKDFKLTQTDVAFIIGCGQPNVAAIEKGNRDLLEEQMKSLEDKYGDLSKYVDNICNEEPLDINDIPKNWEDLANRMQATTEKLLDLLEKEKEENSKLLGLLTELTKKVIEKIAI